MLVHLGRGVSVRDENIIAMTDLQRPQAADVARLVERHRAQGTLRTLGPEPKTLVIISGGRRGGRAVACLSCVGLRTLRRRMELPAPRNGQDESNQEE